MLRRKPIPVLFAVALSLMIHTVVFALIVNYTGISVLKWNTSPVPKRAIDASVPEVLAIVEPLRPDRFVMGEQSGEGEANARSDGDRIQQSPRVLDEQAGLTRESGDNDTLANAAPASVALEASAALKASAAQVPQSFRTPAGATDLASLLPTARSAKVAREKKKSDALRDETSEQSTDAVANAVADANAQQAAKSSPPTPPAQPAAGRPLQQSDRDSDAFASELAVEFVNGRVVSRKGREFKFARPKRNLAAYWDLVSMPAELRMRIDIDEAGTVRRVVILTSTGSASVDRVFELATYESWFEPRKNAQGKAVRDQFEFAMVLN